MNQLLKVIVAITPALRQIFSLTGLVVLMAYLSLYLVQMGELADDPGLGWHLETGRIIAETGAVPTHDPFLAPAVVDTPFGSAGEQRVWVSDQSLGDLILWGLYSLGGWPLLYACAAATYIITFFGIIGDGAKRWSGSALIAFAATAVAFKIGQVHFILRPVLFAFLYFALTLRLCNELARRGHLSWRETAWVAARVAVIFCLWANTHPSFVLGAILVGVYALITLVRRDRRTSDLLQVAVISVACCTATVLTPHGIELHRSIVQLAGSEFFMSLNSEWRPLDLSSFEGRLLIVFFSVPLGIALVSTAVRRSLSGFDVFVALLFFLLALRAVRFLPFSALALVPLVTSSMASLRPVSVPPIAHLVARIFGRIEQRERGRKRSGLFSAVAVSVVGVAGALVLRERMFVSSLGPSEGRYPSGLTEAIAASQVAEGVVLASPNWGGTITARLYPRFKAVIDDRNTLIGEPLYRAYFASESDRAEFERLAVTFRVTHAILPLKSPVAEQLPLTAQWRTLYRDTTRLVVERLPR